MQLVPRDGGARLRVFGEPTQVGDLFRPQGSHRGHHEGREVDRVSVAGEVGGERHRAGRFEEVECLETPIRLFGSPVVPSFPDGASQPANMEDIAIFLKEHSALLVKDVTETVREQVVRELMSHPPG